MRRRAALWTMFLFLAFGTVWAQGLSGSYRLVKDSDGTTPRPGATVDLTFSPNGAFTLRAVQPGETVEDKGRYSVRGSTITMDFEEMEQGHQSGPYSLAGGTLTLPFKMFSGGTGTSQWRAASAAPASTLQEVLSRTLRESQLEKNVSQRAAMDRFVSQRSRLYKGGEAEAYYAQAAVYFLKRYYHEAWYGFAKASGLAPQNAVYLNNLAMVLMELNRYGDARVILDWATAHYPNLDSPFGNLGVCCLKSGDLDCAQRALDRAMALAPENGLYAYAYGKVLEAKGRKEEAKRYYVLGWQNGYAGSGREGEGGGSSGAAGGAGGQGGAGSPGESGGPGGTGPGGGPGGRSPGGRPPSAQPPRRQGFPQEWAGHYEAKYVRAKSSDVSTFGQSLAQTAIKTDTLCCAKAFSMEVDVSGNITGRGRLLYVYLGTAVNPAMGLMPGFAVAGAGGFSATLKNGSQERAWSFTGRVSPEGEVEISGLPSEQMDFLNVGKWQKISCWSPLPPPDKAHMRGPFKMTLATEEKGVPSIYVDQWLALNDKLIKKVHYEAYIFKTSSSVTPDCKIIEPPKAKCPASEYLKTTCSVGPDGAFTVSASRDLGTGEASGQTGVGGDTTGGIGGDSAGNISFSGSLGNATGSMQFNPTDGSYSVSMGMGIDTSSVVPGPFKITQKIELVYDSRCGWGIKGTAGASAGVASAGVEGCIYFNKGV
jgi:hypothetical protein